jgi:hypothetical protein
MSQRVCPFMASNLGLQAMWSRATWSQRKNKLQVTDSHCTALESLQPCLGQQSNEVVEIEISVVVKMIKKTFLPLCRSREVNGQHSAAGFQNPAHFVGTLLASFRAQVMKHDRGQYCIELTAGKRQPFNNAILEDNLGAHLGGLPSRPDKHLGRRVNSMDSAGGADALLGGDGQCASPAADVQHWLAGLEARQIESFLAITALSTQWYQPKENVVPQSSVEDDPCRTRCCALYWFCHASPSPG